MTVDISRVHLPTFYKDTFYPTDTGKTACKIQTHSVQIWAKNSATKRCKRFKPRPHSRYTQTWPIAQKVDDSACARAACAGDGRRDATRKRRTCTLYIQLNGLHIDSIVHLYNSIIVSQELLQALDAELRCVDATVYSGVKQLLEYVVG